MPGFGERLIGCACLGVGAGPRALERRLRLQPRPVGVARLLGRFGGDGSFPLLELRARVRERPSDVGVREQLADELEMAVDLGS